MPISFPPPIRGRTDTWAKNLVKPPFGYVPAPNMGNPGFMFTKDTLDGGMGKIFPKMNPRNPGINFALAIIQGPQDTHPYSQTESRRYLENMGTLNMSMSGVSRDSTGAVLAAANVHIFRTEDNSFVAETTSDGSGAWSIPLLKGGPFFIVAYKTGTPDIAGTTVNTLVPTKV